MLPQNPLDPPAATNGPSPVHVQLSTHPAQPARPTMTEVKKTAKSRTRSTLRAVAQVTSIAEATAQTLARCTRSTIRVSRQTRPAWQESGKTKEKRKPRSQTTNGQSNLQLRPLRCAGHGPKAAADGARAAATATLGMTHSEASPQTTSGAKHKTHPRKPSGADGPKWPGPAEK